VLAHFQAYADRHGVFDNARLNTELLRLERTDGGYRLTLRSGEKDEVLTFPKVVVATGRYKKPTIPPIPGIKSFTGELGVNHCFNYKDPELYRGKHVVVAGGLISALEIASDLAMLGQRR